MPSIEIRDLSEDAYEKLERLAFAAGQSVSQYVRALVLRETRDHSGILALTGPNDPATALSTRARRTQQAFGDAAADSRDSRERWRDL
jgi:predicted CopG family antitoxin